MVVGQRRRLRRVADAPGHAPRGHREPEFQARWNIEDCGPDPCDYAFVEVDDGTGYKAIPGSITKAAEGNGIDGEQAAGRRRRSTCRRSPARRSRCASTTRPTAPRRAEPERSPRASSLDEIKITAGGQTVFERRRRDRQQRLDADGFTAVGATSIDAVRQLLRRVEPDVRVLRPLPAVRAVQLRLPGPARLGRALPVPERAARLLLGHVVHGQQREPASGAGRDPADRRQPAADLAPGRHAVARPDPDLRRAVRAREVRLVHAHARRRAGRATSAARPRSRCSTTAGSTGIRRCRTSA